MHEQILPFYNFIEHSPKWNLIKVQRNKEENVGARLQMKLNSTKGRFTLLHKQIILWTFKLNLPWWGLLHAKIKNKGIQIW